MKVLVKKTVVLELTEMEAFGIFGVLNLAIANLQNVPDGYLQDAKDLVEKFEDTEVCVTR
jgi:hypothetical protein